MVTIRDATEKERKKINAAVTLAKKQLKECGIKTGKVEYITVNRRAKKRWGQCRYLPHRDIYMISLSEKLFEDGVGQKALLEVLLHEYCHTIDPQTVHGPAWKNAAAKLNRKFGYSISRTSTAEQLGIREEKTEIAAKYRLKCEKCGRVYLRLRASRITQHPERYRCTCGGKIHLCA